MSSDAITEAGNAVMRSALAGPNQGRFFLVRAGWLTALFVTLVFAVSAFQAPLQRFDQVAFLDSGGELAVQDLIRRGFRPTIDFGYQYGLVPLFVDRLWFGIAGIEPWALRIELMACAVLSAWGMARFAANRRLGPAGIALIMLAIPDLISVTYMTIIQALEPALLINALAEQARGRRALALALVTACCFVKPSLAYFQGLAVLIAIVAATRRANSTAWARALGPAAVTAVLLGVLLGACFGFLPLMRTIFPRTGLAVYKLNNYGFFNGNGRDWLYIKGGGLRDYFRYEVGFWILGTIVLSWGGIAALVRRARGVSRDDLAINDEVIATCGAVHIAYVLFVFGHRGTWVYSLPMLILGLAALGNRGLWHKAIVWGLALMLLNNDRSKAVEIGRRWKTDARSAVTFGLWASPRERAEWTQALELSRGRPTALLAMCDGGALFTPGIPPPVGAYFVPGNPVPIEVHRKVQQLEAAEVIISAYPPDWLGFEFWPELKAAFEGCERLEDGPTLWVYRRAAPKMPDSTPTLNSGQSPRP
jgi:hypothetical protein